mgnify:CR=1 FL=1
MMYLKQGIDVRWFDPAHEIIVQTYGEHWTVDDFLYATQQAVGWCMIVDHRVDFIVDLSQTNNLPNDVRRLREIAEQHPIPNIGLQVNVRAPDWLRRLVNMHLKSHPHLVRHYRHVNSFGQARDLIKADRRKGTW